MLKYTGHPLVDVGIATIMAFVGKTDPGEVTEDDLTQVADFVQQHYVQEPWKSLFRTAFTNNSWFYQSSYSDEMRQKAASDHLHSWRYTNLSEQHCVFTGLPAVNILFAKEGLALGRAGSAQIPQLPGNKKINFYANGIVGIPISGLALLALQCLPLGCGILTKGFLAVYSENTELIQNMAHYFLKKKQDSFLLEKFRFPRTLLVKTLLEVQEERNIFFDDENLASLTTYRFYNDGRNTDIDINPLNSEAVSFISIAQKPLYQQAWKDLVNSQWNTKDVPKRMLRAKNGQSKDKKNIISSNESKNRLYEDIFTLPQSYSRFIRRYFVLYKPRQSSNVLEVETKNRKEVVSDQYFFQPRQWILVELFLRKVVRMRPAKIQAIKDFAQRIVDNYKILGGKKFLRGFQSRKRHEVTNHLIYCLRKETKDLLIGMEQFITLFCDDDETSNWMLTRDLVVIRVFELLYERDKTMAQESLSEMDEDLNEDDSFESEED